MSSGSTPPVPLWNLERRLGRFRGPDFCADVQLDLPAQGLTRCQAHGHSQPNLKLLGVEIESLSPDRHEILVDHYPRGGDLVATYAQTADRPFRVQIYWRAAPSSAPVSGADLLVSVQTSLLDSLPQLHTLSELGDEAVFQLRDVESSGFAPLPLDRGQSLVCKPGEGPGCFLFRVAQAPWSYVEMIHPADTQGSLVARGPTGGLTLRHELFGLDLEKGVILRARARGAFVPRAEDESLAAQAWRQFIHSPPPLTA